METVDEISFILPVPLPEGSHTGALAAGAITTPAAVPSPAFSGRFIVDTTNRKAPDWAAHNQGESPS